MKKYFCVMCGAETNNENEMQCPSCMTMDSLQPTNKLYWDPEIEDYVYDDYSDNE